MAMNMKLTGLLTGFVVQRTVFIVLGIFLSGLAATASALPVGGVDLIGTSSTVYIDDDFETKTLNIVELSPKEGYKYFPKVVCDNIEVVCWKNDLSR